MEAGASQLASWFFPVAQQQPPPPVFTPYVLTALNPAAAAAQGVSGVWGAPGYPIYPNPPQYPPHLGFDPYAQYAHPYVYTSGAYQHQARHQHRPPTQLLTALCASASEASLATDASQPASRTVVQGHGPPLAADWQQQQAVLQQNQALQQRVALLEQQAALLRQQYQREPNQQQPPQQPPSSSRS